MNLNPTRHQIRTALVICSLLALTTAVSAQQRGNPLRNVQNAAGTRIEFTDAQVGTASYLEEHPDVQYVPVSDHGCCDACGEASCAGCYHGCLALWGSLEYLLWWEKGAQLPPLVTTSVAGTDRDNAGVLGEPGTSILFGGDLESDALSGGRLTVGLWLDPCARLGIAGRGFSLQQNTTGYAGNSNSIPILARPFFNAFTGEPDALLLGFPDEISGNINIALESEVQGAQAFLRHEWNRGCNYRIDWVLGYRYFDMRESLLITDSLEFIDPESNSFGTTIDQVDLFDVQNEFHGGEIGLAGHSVEGRWTLDFLATVSLGDMRQFTQISGSSVATPSNGDPVDLVGGLLTQGTNIGNYTDNQFTVIPEASVTLGYFITPRLDLSIGYTFLYVNHVSRPGQIIDTEVNLTQQTGTLDGPARPEFVFRDSDYWLQGMNFGLNLRY